jgi:hypothetical protein
MTPVRIFNVVPCLLRLAAGVDSNKPVPTLVALDRAQMEAAASEEASLAHERPPHSR